MTMTQEAIEARRRYKREWNRKNADKVKEHQANYWKHKAEEYRNQDESETEPGHGA